MTGPGDGRQDRRGARETAGGRGSDARPRRGDWIFEAEDSFAIDMQGIALLLTAREMANAHRRRVWLAGLPREFWSLMTSMGLEGYFLPFPDPGSIQA